MPKIWLKAKTEEPIQRQSRRTTPIPEEPSGSAEAATESGESQDSQEANQETEAQVQNADTFVKDGVPEINELMERYFAAKQGADIETVYRLFGRTDMEGAEELESEYRYTSRYTDGYENIVYYTKPGTAEDYLVYVSYDLKFKHAETLAPGLFRVYVITNEEGSLQLVDSSLQDESVLQQFEEAEKTDELILLRTEVYAKLRQALETFRLWQYTACLEKSCDRRNPGDQRGQFGVYCTGR